MIQTAISVTKYSRTPPLRMISATRSRSIRLVDRSTNVEDRPYDSSWENLSPIHNQTIVDQKERFLGRNVFFSTCPGSQENLIFYCLTRERNTSSTSITTASSSAGVRTPKDSNFGQSQSYEDERATRQHYDSYQRRDSLLSSIETDVGANQSITDIVAVATANPENYPQTPGRAAGVFEFLTERRKQQDSRPLPSIPAFNSRPSSFSESPSSLQGDHSLEPSQYVRVSQELSSTSRIPIFNGNESSFFDPTTSPTPIIGDSRIPRRIDSRRPITSLDDRLLRNAGQVDQGNAGPFPAVTSREYWRKSSYTEADKAFIMSPGPPRDFAHDVTNGSSPTPSNRALSAYETKENDWSLGKWKYYVTVPMVLGD